MTLRRLLLRSLAFHWRGNLAVFLGVVVGTAVLTGALLVGDSLRGSLRDLTLRQLDWVENVMISGRFVREHLADEPLGGNATPAILLQGSVETGAGDAKRRAGHVTILGVNWNFWHAPISAGARANAPDFMGSQAEATVNGSLAAELGIHPGDSITLRLQKASDVPREIWLGRNDASDVVGVLTVKVTEVIPDDFPGGRFNLRPSSAAPRNVYVPLRTLQKALGVGMRVNAILTEDADPKELQAALAKHLTLDDWGLTLTDSDERAKRFFQSLEPRNRSGKLKKFRWEGRVPEELAKEANADGELTRQQFIAYYRKHHNFLSLESRQLLLEPFVVEAAEAAAKEAGLTEQPTLVYLANTISNGRLELGGLVAALDPAPLASLRATLPVNFRIPYSVVAAGPFAELEVRNLLPVMLPDDAIRLVDWKESPLHARVGDPILLTYFDPERHGSLEERSAMFRLNDVMPLTGAADDADLTPTFPGITDRLDLRNWDPPFPYDNRRVRARDEAYWKRYRTTPKAYVTLAAGEKLWKSRFGQLTSIRLTSPAWNDPNVKPPDNGFREKLLAHLDPAKGGLVFNPIRDEALKASAGGTDFSMLFLGFSFFLIAAALLLVGLLFRLSLDRRAAEAGLLFAVGFRPITVRSLLLAEGGLLASFGAIAGSFAALGYAWAMLELLRILWPGGLEESFLRLHWTWGSIAIGYSASVLVSVLTIAWAVRALGRAAPSALLQGEIRLAATPQACAETSEAGTLPRTPAGLRLNGVSASTWVLVGSIVGAGGCLASAPAVNDAEMKAGMFFGSGFFLLIAGLTSIWVWMRRGRFRPVSGRGWPALARLGCRNATRNPLRSLLTAGLLASAAFLIVAVDSFRRTPDADFLAKDAGSGGFVLMAESAVPLFQDLNTEEGRDKLNLPPAARAALDGVKVYALRLRAGDDASCLNLYQPTRPRLLGVPLALRERGGFHFGATDPKSAEPWGVLDQPLIDGVVPVFGEKNSIEYIFHSKLGDDQAIKLPDQQGQEHRLRIVGLMQDSIFQSELLTSEEDFLKLYPDHAGYNFFLIEAPPERADRVKHTLETALADFGFEATPTRERLQAFLNVENTYLSTFQVLGSLGLLLGALGLAVVLLRNVWERRGELALMRALGYRPRALGGLVLAENAFLLVLGLVVGTVAALLAVAPHLAEAAGNVPVVRLLGVLVLVLAVGLLAGGAAVRATLKTPLLPALRKE